MILLCARFAPVTGTTSSNIAHVILPGIKTLAFHVSSLRAPSHEASTASHFVGASQFWQMGASAEDADTMLAVATQLQAKHKHSYFVIVAPPRASGTAAAPQAFDPDIMLQLQTKLPRGDMRLLLASDMIEAVRTIPKLLQVGGALGRLSATTSSHIESRCGRKRQQSACAPDRRTQV